MAHAAPWQLPSENPLNGPGFKALEVLAGGGGNLLLQQATAWFEEFPQDLVIAATSGTASSHAEWRIVEWCFVFIAHCLILGSPGPLPAGIITRTVSDRILKTGQWWAMGLTLITHDEALYVVCAGASGAHLYTSADASVGAKLRSLVANVRRPALV